nr:MAG TPA: hypothetical protein [Caudoviricetes sp.]
MIYSVELKTKNNYNSLSPSVDSWTISSLY